MVLSGILAYQMDKRKRSWEPSWRNPKAKSPEAESHGDELSAAVREVPTVTFPLVWERAEFGSRMRRRRNRGRRRRSPGNKAIFCLNNKKIWFNSETWTWL
ncbi:hypothetical protein PanWU01x14_235380 [Parasponia andersonii]|uniref:Uncharacterized protein n=1 Tax=Parasponia andersonii TaxID=3476 RepID=A0A2P5BJ62_PARAD|nr:hypothetical protein PanWU01x14_235380 [Parasponia andersonii]